MFHAVYDGTALSTLNIEVQSGTPVYPLALQPSYPQSIPQGTATAIRVQWGSGWTDFMDPVYNPTVIPGTNGQLKANWSPDNQLVVIIDEQITG